MGKRLLVIGLVSLLAITSIGYIWRKRRKGG
jgi:hypothetical protein